MAGRDGLPDDPNVYRRARIAAGLLLIGALIVSGFIHLARGERVDPVELGLMLGGSLTLLGIQNRLVR